MSGSLKVIFSLAFIFNARHSIIKFKKKEKIYYFIENDVWLVDFILGRFVMKADLRVDL